MKIEITHAEIIGENIRKLLAARGWSETKLAQKSGVSQRMVNNFLRVNLPGNPTLESLEKLSKALGVPLWKLTLPNQTVDQLQNKAVNDLVEIAMSLDPESAAHVLSVARRERERG
jgi:transcriptional regulator with XRE-family HTH domain